MIILYKTLAVIGVIILVYSINRLIHRLNELQSSGDLNLIAAALELLCVIIGVLCIAFSMIILGCFL